MHGMRERCVANCTLHLCCFVASEMAFEVLKEQKEN